jgi:signal transduction histidine kinase
MRRFIQRALGKLPKLDEEQIRSLLFDLASENEMLEVVLNSMADGVLVADPRHKLVFSNSTAGKLLPMARRDSDEIPIWESIDDREVAQFIREVLEEGREVSEEEFTIEIGSTTRTLVFRISHIYKEDQESVEARGNLILVSDITEKKRREARLRRAESLASLTTLAAGVAHEIKNPLGSIGIHIQLIQKALKQQGCLEQETAEKYLEVINEEIERLNGIVVDFLFAVRPMDTNMKRMDVHQVIDELVNFIRYELEQSGVTIEKKQGRNLPRLDLDQKYLKQALLNIVKNGQAAMPEGGTLTIATREEEGYVHIDISDTGVGIDEEKVAKIFEPYYTTKDSGSGLGLTVAYKVVNEHGGEISVKSKEGKGTTFTLSFPIPDDEKRLLDWQCEEAEEMRECKEAGTSEEEPKEEKDA